MKIHEYQAAALLRQYGVTVSDGQTALSPEEAYLAARKLSGDVIVKAQVHSGGRGKAGGVKRARSPEEAERLAREMLGKRLVTKQTGPEGKPVRLLYLTRSVEIKKEFYLSLLIDGAAGNVVLLASGEGGTEIEEVAEKNPEKIVKLPVDVTIGLRAYQAREAADQIGIPAGLTGEFVKTAQSLYRLLIEKDCSMVEINPLVITDDDRLLALDAKVGFDDNALFRHKDIQSLRDVAEEDPREVRAAEFDLNYIQLSGEIGCMVNGAGLAMGTMDIIRHFGGYPANFLDVGGSATEEKVAGAFEILLSDPNVRGVLVNIFGGIMRCDIIARGIVAAAGKLGVKVPVVVRLEGANAREGREILRDSGLSIVPAETLEQAARTVVALTREQEVSA